MLNVKGIATMVTKAAKASVKSFQRILGMELHMSAPLESRVELSLSEWDMTRKGYRVQLASGSRPIVFEGGRFTLPGIGFTPRHRIALVHHTPGLFEANDMIDVVAGNRGLNIRNFRDLESALAWLG